MFNVINLLATADFTYKSPTHEVIHGILNTTMIVLMCLAALVAIVLVLMQPSNSSGIDALGGSSETFFGKNKGKSIEEKMKKWTWICLIVLGILSLIFFLVQKFYKA
jgi:preprotein translocase subunit SecG